MKPLWSNPDEIGRAPAAEADAPPGLEGMDRREFWRVMGAAVAMAGFTGCVRQPPEKIVPYVNQPADIVQGEPIYFATTMPLQGEALGLLVKSHMGHPVKVEGNPRHPASLGATDAFAQASLMTLYDPDRSQAVLHSGRISDWTQFLAALPQSARLRLLTDTVISPTLGRQIRALLSKYPGSKWHQWEAAGRDNARAGAQMAFGSAVNPVYRFDRADVVFSLDADFLCRGLAGVRNAHDFAARRGSRSSNVNRLYVAEAAYTNTGASADHRFRVKPGEMGPVLRALAGGPPPAEHAKWLAAVNRDLQAHRGASLVLVGDQQPPELHALAHSINASLGNAGNTVVYLPSNEVEPVDQLDSLRTLIADMRAGNVDLLIMSGVNPAYDAPADLDFAGALRRVATKVHHGLYDDETAVLCDWHIPATTYLEEWSDAVAYDGTASIIQPLIAPLYRGRSKHELLAALLGEPDRSPYAIVQETWRRPDFETFWRTALHDGFIAGASEPVAVTPRAGVSAQPAAAHGAYEIQFRPDATILDGRFANNPYLQELPKTPSMLTWDSVAMVSPATAKRLNLQNGALIQLDHRGRKTEFPLWVQPGHADDTATVTLGYGRKRAGRAGNCGFDIYPLRTSDALWQSAGVKISQTGRAYELAATQQNYGSAGRFPVRLGSLETYRRDPHFAHKEPFEEAPPRDFTLYPEWRHDGYQWGASVDLNACVGCNACIAACDSENNIATVGKHQVYRGRIMHWLRIDRYYEGEPDAPRALLQPNFCMHCENAPCELVCPTNATNHSSEGLNQMVYNRCVGTRYCSNNCPYKVRRFNFYLYTDWATPSYQLMRNPEVTPRSRGVMEKCTYCVQRIEAAKIKAEIEDRTVRDGEIRTACQQACPTGAIVFGDLNDRNSRVAQLKRQPLDYALLGELNTRPRTTYLARVLNPNPELDRESL
ncbi:MAG: 4Fe-4S dicluster domain-containing protein [Acidobacteriota bacterium]